MAIQGWGSSGNPFPADSFRSALFTFNTPQLGPTQKGMDFPMVQDTDVVGKVDLQKVVVDAGVGANPAALKKNTTTAALAFNELLPIIPLWERYGNNPALISEVTGYPPATVKQAVVGHGRATKEQVSYLVRALLSMRRAPAADAADALAIAICHARSGTARVAR